MAEYPHGMKIRESYIIKGEGMDAVCEMVLEHAHPVWCPCGYKEYGPWVRSVKAPPCPPCPRCGRRPEWEIQLAEAEKRSAWLWAFAIAMIIGIPVVLIATALISLL